MANQIAPKGTVFVCAACGKQSRDTYGDKKISRGWDESCMLHAVLCWDTTEEERRVRAIRGEPEWEAVTSVQRG